MNKEYNVKRVKPPFWQHDFHVLQGLNKTLEIFLQRYVKLGDTLVDYGCASSPYKDLFLTRVGKYIGVDIKKSQGVDIVVSEDKKIPLRDKKIDIILSTQVLEHVKNVDFYLRECRRLLKKDGIFILSTHGVWPYHPYPEDYNRWTKNGLIYLLKLNEFECLKVVSILGPFATVAQYELLLIAQILLKKGLIGKSILVFISIVGNAYIWLLDKLFSSTEDSDSALYVICARKK